MKLPKAIQIEKATSGDPSRPVLGNVYLQKLEDQPHPARLIATTGRIAAIVPVMLEDGDTPGYVPPEALKAARTVDRKSETAGILCGPVCKLANGLEIARPDLGTFPNIDMVIPKTEVKWRIALDPLILLAVAQAIGSERGLILEIGKEGEAIRLRPCNNPRAENAKGRTVPHSPACVDALGLIMPLRTEPVIAGAR